ncbi:hypothetical protein KD815_01505 [Klebsiella quasipneumoniae]|uniref:DUF7448 domain-containing protein n=1 Tax=Klebsiella quasipneumoniae TaxID=1463165 RepID=UPI002369D6B6|nr:hypothetical protein [Klebsiella quasipneumoniae]
MSVTVIDEMLFKVFGSVEKSNDGTELIFRNNGWDEIFTFFHEQDCCESVWIEDIEGDLSDLEYSPILEAEVVSNKETDDSCDSRTWTFSSLEQQKDMLLFAGVVKVMVIIQRV